MSDVFIVTSGEYSDYQIDHVFSSEELAIKYVGENSDLQVEVYRLDPDVDFTTNIKSSIGVDMEKDGGVKNIRGVKSNFGVFEKQASVKVWQPFLQPYGYPDTNPYRDTRTEDKDRSYLECVILTRDEETAVKTVNEIRLRLLALDRWPKPPFRVVTFDYKTLEEKGRHL